VVAQVLFEPTTVINRGFKKRRELQNAPPDDETQPKGRRRRRREDRKSQVRATVRPTPAVIERGAGLGLRFRF
jgi:hypothetical protein